MKKKKLKHIKSTKNSFKVPQGYFETIEDAVFAKLAAEKLPKKEGFLVPDTYFETIEDGVLKKIQEEKKQSQTGFSVPTTYLETIEDTVFTRLTEENTIRQSKVISLKTIILKRVIPLAAAASLALFMIIKYTSQPTVDFESIASAEIEQWIDEDLVTFDTYEIAEVYNDIDLDDTTIFEEDELVDYLNGTDVESLLLEN